MKQNVVQEKGFELAIAVIHFVKKLEHNREYVVSRQLLKCGTSIGANIEEALAAESKKDFLHKLLVATKEARETKFWLRLLEATKYKQTNETLVFLSKTEEILCLLHSITKTLNKQLKL